VLGDLCEYGTKLLHLFSFVDNCTDGVYVKLEKYSGAIVDPSEKSTCAINPALFQCYQEAVPMYVEAFSNISNPSFLDRLHHILRIYGPFKEVRNIYFQSNRQIDKLFFQYWFHGQDFSDPDNAKIVSDMPPAPVTRLAFIIMLDNEYAPLKN
jgi:hypothetical protein